MTRIPVALRRLTVVTVSISLFCLQPPGHPSRAKTSPTAPELTREAVEQGAARYAQAVERLASVASMPLQTEADFKKAATTLAEASGDLDSFKYRMIQLALSNDAFTQAVKAEVSKAKGDALAVRARFRRDRKSLLSLNGASQIRQSIRAELGRDLGRVRAAAERVQKAAAQATGGKTQGATAAASGASTESAAGVDNFFAALFTASTMVAGAVTSGRPRPKQTSSGQGGSGGTSAGTGSGDEVNEGMEQEKKFDDCVSNASKKEDACKDRCGPGLFQWACLANCDAGYVIAKLGCMISAFG